MNRVKVRSIKAPEIGKVDQIFTSKGWDVATPYAGVYFKQAYNDLLEMLSFLTKSEAELIFDLIEDFEWFYESRYKYSLDQISQHISNDPNVGNRPAIVPILKIGETKPKSSIKVLYDIKEFLVDQLGKVGSYPVFFNDMSSFVTKINTGGTNFSSVIYLDDFVGTGNSVKDAIDKCKNNINSNTSLKYEKICCIACHELGEILINSMGMNLHFEQKILKGIHSKFTGLDLANNISLMRQIENKISVKKEYKFGYGACEALIKLARTPNNTLPVFWYTDNWVSPFPRKS